MRTERSEVRMINEAVKENRKIADRHVEVGGRVEGREEGGWACKAGLVPWLDFQSVQAPDVGGADVSGATF